MLSYRVIATRHGAQLTCQAEIHTHDAKTNAWDWQPVHTWSLDCPSPENLPATLSHELATQGWDADPTTIPTHLPATLAVQPRDHALILRHLTDHIAELARYKTALKAAVADVPTAGHAGHLTTSEISRITGISRQQLASYRNH